MCLIQCSRFYPCVPQSPLVLTSSSLRNTRGLRYGRAGLLGRSWRGRESEVFCPVKISVGVGLSSSDIAGTATTDSESPQASRGIFPGGLRRSEIKLPGLVLRVRAEEITEGDVSNFLAFLSVGVATGVTVIVLDAGAEGPAGGASLYEAARNLKALLRGRAQLLVSERVDIAAAAGADGVLLSDQGLPAAVARRMMQTSLPEVSVLPIVGRRVSTKASALSATAGEGADLLILTSSEDAELQELVKAVSDQVSIPVFVETSYTRASFSDSASATVGLEILKVGGNGVVLNAVDACVSAERDVPLYFTSLLEALGLAIQQRVLISSGDLSPYTPQANGSGSEVENFVETTAPCKKSLDSLASQIVEEERQLLSAMINFVRDASSEMEEVSLLADALEQLDELFLIVVVGEFNSGKSSLINALLGKKFLKEGVLPTTNEITLLRHCGDAEEAKERSERHPDGHFMQFLRAPLLKQMNLVDTPGTNVILQRQQRLTEEFVPRADLILFVLSADRPLTESEVSFLRYIRQWGKKVVFILNKSDVLKDLDELDEVTKFVAENAQRFLSIESAVVYPVSARQALKAKIAVERDGVVDAEWLYQDADWRASGFDNLENFIMGFMGGSTDAGAERIRLKLDTPLGIGVALLAACERKLSADKEKVVADLQTLAGIEEQIQRYVEALQKTAVLQRQRTLTLVEVTKDRADQFIDSILRLSNVEVAAKYIIGTDMTQSLPVTVDFERKVLSSAYASVQVALEEHATWLLSNNERQLCSSVDNVRSRWPDLGKGPGVTNAEDLVKPDNKRILLEPNTSMEILKGFDTNAAMILLEQEMREVVMGTFGGIGAAGLSASVLTSVLPTTLEDLIALAVCSAGGLVGVVNLPGRRAEVKKKVSRVADSLGRQIEAAMQEDLQEAIRKIREDVDGIVTPYRTAARQESDRIASLEVRLERLDKQLRSLRSRVQNLGA